MKKEGTRNLRLGIFVLAGTALLIAALYLVGTKQNLFGSTFNLYANFSTVSGLMEGNNVRYAGIDVGTVSEVMIVNDSNVRVTMMIEESVQKYIRKNCKAAVSTDGLMGNKLVNITPSSGPSPMVEPEDVLATVAPIEIEQMIRTLSVTNDNMKDITANLKDITERFRSRNTIWSLLTDEEVAENIKASIVQIRKTSDHTLQITGDLHSLVAGIKNGKGSLGALVTDTALYGSVKQTVLKFEKLSDSLAVLSGDISDISGKLKKGEGSIGVLLNDTAFVHHLNQSMKELNKGTILLNEDLEALKHTFPLKRYFKKQEKKKKKAVK
ncbi:MAG: MCE family protein [Bacteroidia bacterium]|nr:MCE family protein [Bacteroidia bacterium]